MSILQGRESWQVSKSPGAKLTYYRWSVVYDNAPEANGALTRLQDDIEKKTSNKTQWAVRSHARLNTERDRARNREIFVLQARLVYTDVPIRNFNTAINLKLVTGVVVDVIGNNR